MLGANDLSRYVIVRGVPGASADAPVRAGVAAPGAADSSVEPDPCLSLGREGAPTLLRPRSLFLRTFHT